MKRISTVLTAILVALVFAGGVSTSASAAARISVALPSVAGGETANIPVTITGVTYPTVRVVIEATNGTLSLDYSTSSVIVTPGYGDTDSGSQLDGAELSFSAALADVTSLLADHLTFTSTEAAGSTYVPALTIRISEYGVIVDPTSGHTYVYSGILADNVQELSWFDAQAHAATTSRSGNIGYLANINSSAENVFIATKSGIQNVWIGATADPTTVAAINTSLSLPTYVPTTATSQTDGHYLWGAGSEKGQNFSNGLEDSVVTVAGKYSNWAEGEPNNSSGTEGCGVTNWQSTNGFWNDLDCERTEFYMIEYNTSIEDAPVALTYDSTTDELANTGLDSNSSLWVAFAGLTLIMSGLLVRKASSKN